MKYTLPAAIIISAIVFSYAYMNRLTDYQYCVENLEANAHADNTRPNLFYVKGDTRTLRIDRVHQLCLTGD